MLNLIVVADRYATEHPNSFISVWFRARDDPAVPADVKAGGGSVDTDSWVGVRSVRRSLVANN
jgi:hypothetical protein